MKEKENEDNLERTCRNDQTLMGLFPSVMKHYLQYELPLFKWLLLYLSSYKVCVYSLVQLFLDNI